MFAPNLNSSPPSLRGLILRITTLSDAEGKERKERKAGRGGRMEKSVRVDFVFRSNFCKGEIPSPPLPSSPGIGKKQSDVQARETKLILAISNRAIVRASSPNPVRVLLLFLLLLLQATLHFNALRGDPVACNNILLLPFLSPL